MLSREKERLIRRLKRRRTREREGSFLVEGIRAVEEALAAEAAVRLVVCSPRLWDTARGRALAERLDQGAVTPSWVDEAELGRLSDTDAPQGVLLVCTEPRSGLDELEVGSGGRFLFLDGVQDPGNVGTLVRAARAFALSGIVALDGTSDPWSAKAVRASAGSALHIPLVTARWSDCARWATEFEIEVLVGDVGGADVETARPRGPWALVVGSEGAGARVEVRAAAARTVAVHMPGGAESLNAAVAGAILMYVLTRENEGA